MLAYHNITVILSIKTRLHQTQTKQNSTLFIPVACSVYDLIKVSYNRKGIEKWSLSYRAYFTRLDLKRRE